MSSISLKRQVSPPPANHRHKLRQVRALGEFAEFSAFAFRGLSPTTRSGSANRSTPPTSTACALAPSQPASSTGLVRYSLVTPWRAAGLISHGSGSNSTKATLWISYFGRTHFKPHPSGLRGQLEEAVLRLRVEIRDRPGNTVLRLSPG